MTPVVLDTRSLLDKINKILSKTKITSVFIGWNKDSDLSDIVQYLKRNGAEIYLWLPVFSELDSLVDFSPLIIGQGREKAEISFSIGTEESFLFYCPSSNIEKIISIYERYYNSDIYDGVFLDKIRYPSFIGGIQTVISCYCDYCMAGYDFPEPGMLLSANAANPLGIVSYKDLHYRLDEGFEKLFDRKCDVIYHSLENLCTYFRGKGMKIGFDLFAPFLAYFVGQDYSRILGLADFVKPMFYGMTNAPAGMPFEIDMYAKAFDDDSGNFEKRKKSFMDIVGCGDDFIGKEITGIKRIIDSNAYQTKLYAGIELNYIERIAPVTKEYIRESVTKISKCDGVVASWDLNTISDSHIDCFLESI